MKKILTILLIFVTFSVNSQQIISNDTIWQQDTLFVENDILVEEGACLSIMPGKNIIFNNYSGIQIKGSLKAIGSQSDTIYFMVSDTTGFSDTASVSGAWKGIYFTENNSDTSYLQYCSFSNGKSNSTKNFELNDETANKGGAIIIDNYDNIKIGNCTIKNNYASFKGGGIYILGSDNTCVDSCIFRNNFTYYNGGGIYIQNSMAIINSNIFNYNTALNIDTIGGYIWYVGTGSAIYSSFCNYGNPIISNNKINGSIGVSGCIYDNNIYAEIYNNIIVNNQDVGYFNGHGGSHTHFINNLVSNNSVYYSFYSGVGFFSADLIFRNNIIWGNEAGVWGDPEQIYDFEDEITVEYSCVQYGFTGEGNISSNPQFTNPPEGAGIEYDGLSADWTLLETSPCINTGTPDTTGLNLPEFDIAGNQRVFGGRIDMGAYENQSVYVKINDSQVYSKIKLYTNPGTDKIYIDIPPEINCSWIDIVDGQGRVLMHEKITVTPSVLFPYKLNSGIYFYRIYSDNQVVKSGKWIKR
ncbi:MAG: hypothetical protein C0598_06370 [Marinilabiliales bacterium]|nr:MAG: hypothetical protein C0598_06370 [Marinilabiliales bacterium]